MPNTNKQGYKKTKIGWIPEDWMVNKLKELGRITSGGTPGRDRADYWNGDIPWVTTTNINFKTILETEEHITEDGLKNSSAKLFLPGTLLMAMYGQGKTRGKVAILGIEATTNQACAAISLKDTVHNAFIFYNLSSRYNEIRSYSNTGNQENLNGEIIKNIIIPLPPLPEQQKIAEILSTWDEAIEKTQLLLEKLRLRKKGLMQQLLTGKTRLKGFSGEWKDVKLGDVASRLTAKNEELNDNVVTISAQRGFVKQEDFFKKRVASDTLSGYYLIEKGQFAYNKSYSNGYPMGAFKRLDTLDKAVVTTLYICFELKSNVDSNFILDYFEAGLMVPNLMKIAQEGGRAHGLLNIALNDFFSLKMIIPKIEEQQAIATVLTSADKEIKVQETYLQQLQAQKKGLMQKLLTGEVRVKTNI